MKGDTPSACMNSSNLSLSSSRYVPSMPTYASGMLRLDTVLSCLFNSATILSDWRVTMLGGQLPLIRRIRPALVFPISTSQCQSGRKPQGSLESSAIIVSRYSQIWPLRNTLNCLPNYVWMTVSPEKLPKISSTSYATPCPFYIVITIGNFGQYEIWS